METIILIGQILIGLLLLTFLVVIHELGHAIVARRNGVVVEEFGIGFPPKAWSRKLKNKIILSVNWLPLGGFVKLKGESDDASKKGDYGAANLWVKTKILLAGVAINWLAAAIIFTGLALVGFPKVIPNQFHVASDTVETTEPLKVVLVEPGSPANKAGLSKDDTLISLGGQAVNSPEQLMSATKHRKGKNVLLVYRHSENIVSKNVHLRQTPGKNQGILGVSSASKSNYRSTWSAPIVGVGTTVQFSVLTLNGLKDLVGNVSQGLSSQLSGNKAVREKGSQELSAAGANVAGPIGILGVIFPAAQQAGPVALLLLVGLISLTLAVMNALPIPALDGGRLFVTLLFRAIRKPLNKDLEQKIHGAGFTVLLVLIAVITIADVFKFF